MTPEMLNEVLLDIQDDRFAGFVIGQAIHELTEAVRPWVASDSRQAFIPDFVDQYATAIAAIAGIAGHEAYVREWLCDIAYDLALEGQY